jgi:ribosomal protein L11 methyltransferase
MPYRIDTTEAGVDAFDRLVDLGALDIEVIGRRVAALMPDTVSLDRVRDALSTQEVEVSPAQARDNDSVWILRPRPLTIGRFSIAPADVPASADTLRLNDNDAFGTGLHPTTALCLETLDEMLEGIVPERVLDIGTGSGVLALAALRAGVSHAVGLDIERTAVQAAAQNAQLNSLSDRFHGICGTADAVKGSWPLVFANILAGPLMEMAPVVVRRVAGAGTLVLSGIPDSVASQVAGSYEHLGMRLVQSKTREGWTALILRATW